MYKELDFIFLKTYSRTIFCLSQSTEIANRCSRLCNPRTGRANFTVRTRWNFNWPLPTLAITKHNRICSTVWTMIDKSAIRYYIDMPRSICVTSGKSTNVLSLECKRNEYIHSSMYTHNSVAQSNQERFPYRNH